MSAPGLMYYFSDMQSLLEAVLEHRDEVDLAAIVPEDVSEQSLGDLIDGAAAYYVERLDDQRSFDALEAEALDPNHPAHSWFAERNERNIQLLRPVIEREFADPDTCRAVVSAEWARTQNTRRRLTTPAPRETLFPIALSRRSLTVKRDARFILQRCGTCSIPRRRSR